MSRSAMLLAHAGPALLITMLPGPDTIVVSRTAARFGRRAASRAAPAASVSELLA